VARLVTWEERRPVMKGACLTCHHDTYGDNCYQQFDALVMLYYDTLARPAKAIMDDLLADGVLNPNAPFEHHVQWVYFELWHHEGRRARHGASMMGPDYTHWHGMYEVSKNFYQEFLPAVVEVARTKGAAMGRKYEQRVEELLAQEEHQWVKGLSDQEAEELRQMYQQRYNE
jgi:hydroxylamine dehydrogenase